MALNTIKSLPQFNTIRQQTHWYTVNANFDPKTGEALPQKLSDFLNRAGQTPSEQFHDRVWRIAEHVRTALNHLFRDLKEAPLRIHSVQHIRKVRELDVSSFVKLGNRPGRNIREKLADKPYLQAVERIQSVDLPENQLLKEFVTQLAVVLADLEVEDSHLPMIQDWLQTSDAKSISRWRNLPPNNALLSHHDYRLVWDAWGWLQTLENDLKKDAENIEARKKTVAFWGWLARLKKAENIHFAEVPLFFDYDRFEISSWTTPVIRLAAPQPIEISEGIINPNIPTGNPREEIWEEIITEPVCIDLTSVCPSYSTGEKSRKCQSKLIWQNWSRPGKSVDIELFDADAVWLHHDATTITSTDIFFSQNHTREHLDRASRSFAKKLRTQFRNDTFLWLVPDYLNDFELEILRRNINSQFPDAQPLPRSIAAVFENISSLPENVKELSVLVLDSIGNCPCATPLIGNYDSRLAKRAPETKGYQWTRQPSFFLGRKEPLDTLAREIDQLDAEGNWTLRNPLQKRTIIVSKDDFKNNFDLGDYTHQFNLSKQGTPINGGLLFYQCQQKAGDIPLWRDNLPELSIKIVRNGYYDKFYLVKEAVIRPQRGIAMPISVSESFRLPAGKSYYEFQLHQGEGKAQLNYAIVLKSPAFPLKKDLSCKLEMSYTYGVDQPYKLVFQPEDPTVCSAIEAEWRPMKQVENVLPETLPVPQFPALKTWRDFVNYPKKNSNETNNLLEWCSLKMETLIGWGNFDERELSYDFLQERQTGYFVFGRYDSTNHYYCFVDVDGQRVFCHSAEFLEPADENSLEENDIVYLNVYEEYDGRLKGRNVSFSEECPPQLRYKIKDQIDRNMKTLKKAIYDARFPVITIWNGHSLQDANCPNGFRTTMYNGIQAAQKALDSKLASTEVKEEIFYILCCLNKDAPGIVPEKLLSVLDNPQQIVQYYRNLGFAIGDAQLPWQKELFEKLFEIKKAKPIIQAMVLNILAVAFWRSQSLIHLLSKERWLWLAEQLIVVLKHDLKKLNSEKAFQYCQHLCCHCELLFAYLRCRESKSEEIQNLLIPNNDLTNRFVDVLDEVIKTVIENNIKFKSRINIQIAKSPMFEQIPDLLYAIRLYLTGDSGANTIIIEGIEED